MHTESPALRAALHVIDPVMASENPTQAVIAAKCAGLMIGYHSRWHNDQYRINEVECFVESDLWNPESGRKSRSFRVAGKIDLRATAPDGTPVIFDHKTTSSDITDPDSTYWRQLAVESQATHYLLLEWLNGRKADVAIWDVVRKPTISPKALTKADVKAVVENGVYYGKKLTTEDIALAEISGRETLLMYMWRLSSDCIIERPEWYFQRRPVLRLGAEVVEYASELWDHGQDLLAVRATERNPRNSGACMLYGSPCKYLGICSGHDTPDSDNWQRRAWVHPELKVLEGDGRDILTNSRIRTFQTCRRKHQLQYEQGIERVDEQESDALYFGDLFHRALEAYFLTLRQQQEQSNER